MRILVAIILIVLFSSLAYALRISKPYTFSLPWTEEQMSRLNAALTDLWNITNGKYNLDIVTTPKTDARNGDMWLIYTSPVTRIQYKSAGLIYTITPDGY